MCIYNEVLLARVDRLQRCASLDVDYPANGNVMTLWRFTKKHREPAGKDNERLLLLAVYVTLAPRTWLVAPDIRATVLGADRRLKFSYMSSRLAPLVRARDPLKLLRQNDRKGHAPEHTDLISPALPGPVSPRQGETPIWGGGM